MFGYIIPELRDNPLMKRMGEVKEVAKTPPRVCLKKYNAEASAAPTTHKSRESMNIRGKTERLSKSAPWIPHLKVIIYRNLLFINIIISSSD